MTEKLGSATLATNSSTVYRDLLEVDFPAWAQGLSFRLKENNTNNVKYKIQGTLDEVNYEDIQTETALNKNAATYKTPSVNIKLCDPWISVRVQILTASGTSHGNVTAVAIAQ